MKEPVIDETKLPEVMKIIDDAVSAYGSEKL